MRKEIYYKFNIEEVSLLQDYLRQQSLEGYRFVGFEKSFGILVKLCFEQNEKKEVFYYVDIMEKRNDVFLEDQEAYLKIYEDFGFTHISSLDSFQVFTHDLDNQELHEGDEEYKESCLRMRIQHILLSSLLNIFFVLYYLKYSIAFNIGILANPIGLLKIGVLLLWVILFFLCNLLPASKSMNQLKRRNTFRMGGVLLLLVLLFELFSPFALIIVFILIVGVIWSMSINVKQEGLALMLTLPILFFAIGMLDMTYQAMCHETSVDDVVYACFDEVYEDGVIYESNSSFVANYIEYDNESIKVKYFNEDGEQIDKYSGEIIHEASGVQTMEYMNVKQINEWWFKLVLNQMIDFDYTYVESDKQLIQGYNVYYSYFNEFEEVKTSVVIENGKQIVKVYDEKGIDDERVQQIIESLIEKAKEE